jgi:hypothetical protein
MRLSLIFLLLTLAACRERYGLPLEAAKNNLLVVEGNILNGDTTRIRLSRTSPIAERTLVAESGATLQIEGDDNSVVPLVESPTEPGTYSSPPLTLNNARQYRLRIYSGDKEYESAWLTVVNTAPIDSVFWQRDERDNGVEISVASRGSDADSRYYKWDYDEVWEFHAKYECTAYFTYVLMPNGTKEYRCLDVTHDGFTYNTCLEPWFYPPNGQRNDSMYTCWKYQTSRNINIGSAASFSNNTIVKPVRKIERDSWELSWLYSIMVKQTGLSKEGYDFYRILEGNSESLGTIFDAQPSEMKTNLRCVTTAAETVIGFVDATTVQTKRLFIGFREVPDWTKVDIYYSGCTDTLQKRFMTYEEQVERKLVPTLTNVSMGPPPYRIGLAGLTYPYCADCTMRGEHRRPDFWP